MFRARLCQTKHSIVLAQQIPKTQSVILQILLHSPLGDKTKCEQNNCNKPIWYLTSKSNLIKLSYCADQAATGGCECLHNRARFKILKMVRLHSHHGREGGTWALLPGKSFCRIIICLKSAKDSQEIKFHRSLFRWNRHQLEAAAAKSQGRQPIPSQSSY